MSQKPTFNAVQQFDSAPDSMLVDIPTACTIADRSRASIYRHFHARELIQIKVGNSTRIRVGDLRRLIQAKRLTINSLPTSTLAVTANSTRSKASPIIAKGVKK